MGLRETLREKPAIGIAVAAGFLAVAIAVIAYTFWPAKKADLSRTFYSVDDGTTWFVDSAFQVPPFDHDGKQAVVAEVYTYDDGKKEFCAYLAKLTPEAHEQLQKAVDAAKASGQSPSSVSLYHDRKFLENGTLVKKPGTQNSWTLYSDPRANEVMAIHSPDGSAVDQAFVY